ncbi:MAG: hypothetical protein IPL02_06215 [Moraxellaceae bacterium]|nr:hypothetical protein [Moraxellaceae bacterium]
MSIGSLFIALTVFFNVSGTALARVYATEDKVMFIILALLSYTLAF